MLHHDHSFSLKKLIAFWLVARVMHSYIVVHHIAQLLWNVLTCPFAWCLLWAHHFSYKMTAIHDNIFDISGVSSYTCTWTINSKPSMLFQWQLDILQIIAVSGYNFHKAIRQKSNCLYIPFRYTQFYDIRHQRIINQLNNYNQNIIHVFPYTFLPLHGVWYQVSAINSK